MSEHKNDISIRLPKFNYNDFLNGLRKKEETLLLAEKRYLEFLEQNRAADKIRDKHPHDPNSRSVAKKFADLLRS
ncbi:hypothetical protein KAI54_01995 [Candidatus Gracilibacteria bacterium]|nr:hypothetical protein [Candidatus Gracilibacteria bacterium]